MELTDADRREIMDLSHRYATAADNRDFVGLGALFAVRGVLAPTPGVTRVGPHEIAEAVTALERYDSTFHLLGQIRTWVDSTGAARGETYCIAHHFRTKDGSTTDHVMYIRYQDRFVQEDGWRFAERELAVTWAGPEPKGG